MIFACILCILLGLIRPGIRGQLLTTMTIGFVLIDIGSGYIAGRFKDTLEITIKPILQSLVVTFFVPGVFFIYYLFINSILAINKEHGTVQFNLIIGSISYYNENYCTLDWY